MINKKIFTLAILTTMIVGGLPLVNADTKIWESWVYSNGTPVTTPISLANGVKYKIVVSEVFYYDKPHNYAADAMYYTTQYPDSFNWGNHLPAPNGHSFLQINGNDVNWGPFSNGDTYHTYTITYTGTGAPITFQIIDWIDGYANNYCHLVVKIYEPERYYGATPGYWKQSQHFNAWPAAYQTGDKLSDVFGVSAPDATLLQALQGGGGTGVTGAKNILARAAVAALLNSLSMNYRYTDAEVISKVSAAFASGNRATMLTLASELDNWNNMGWPQTTT
jgi:hypothetical protein